MVLLRRGSTCASGQISCYAQTSKRAGVPLCVSALTLHTSRCEMSIEQASDLSALLRWDCKLSSIVYDQITQGLGTGNARFIHKLYNAMHAVCTRTAQVHTLIVSPSLYFS